MAHSAAGLDDRKMLVAQAVHRTMLARGLQGVNLRDIARELGMTTGFLTHYFRDKAELLLFAKDMLMQDMMRGAREAGGSAAGWGRLQVVCEHLLPLTPERADTWLVFFAFLGSAVGDRKLMHVQLARYRASHRFFEEELSLLVSAGHLPRVIDLSREALALASFVDGLVINALFSSAREQRDLQCELLAQFINRALKRRDTTRTRRRDRGTPGTRSAT